MTAENLGGLGHVKVKADLNEYMYIFEPVWIGEKTK